MVSRSHLWVGIICWSSVINEKFPKCLSHSFQGELWMKSPLLQAAYKSALAFTSCLKRVFCQLERVTGPCHLLDLSLLGVYRPSPICRLLNPPKYVVAFQSSLWLSLSSGFPFKCFVRFLFVSTKITAWAAAVLPANCYYF